MHTLQLHLKTTEYDDRKLDERFFILWKVHNIMVKHAIRQIGKFRKDKEYKALSAAYKDQKEVVSAVRKEAKKRIVKAAGRELTKDEMDEALLRDDAYMAEKNRLSAIGSKMNDIKLSYGLSENLFQKYLSVQGHKYRKHLTSQQIQVEASRVWKGASDVLNGKGKKLHFKLQAHQ